MKEMHKILQFKTIEDAIRTIPQCKSDVLTWKILEERAVAVTKAYKARPEIQARHKAEVERLTNGEKNGTLSPWDIFYTSEPVLTMEEMEEIRKCQANAGNGLKFIVLVALYSHTKNKEKEYAADLSVYRNKECGDIVSYITTNSIESLVEGVHYEFCENVEPMFTAIGATADIKFYTFTDEKPFSGLTEEEKKEFENLYFK